MAVTINIPQKSFCLAATTCKLSKRQTSDLDPIHVLINSRVKHNGISVNPKLFLAGSAVGGGWKRPAHRRKMDFAVCTSKKPETPVTADPLPTSWKLWTLGTIMTIILSFSTGQLGPLLKVEEKVETATKAAEHVTEMVEEVASKVEEAVEDAANHLPIGKPRDAALFFENVAQEIEKDAHMLEDALKKAQEVEKGVESFFQSMTHQQNTVITTEAEDQK